MTPDELREAIALGREQRGTEFKGPGRRDDKAFLANVTRAVLGMANKADGGVVVIGVTDTGTTLVATGLSEEQVETWKHDDVHASISNYADPYVEFDVEVVTLDGAPFVAVLVRQFLEFPVLCKKDYQGTLRNGALYIRRHGKNETVEVPSHVEMREIIDRAAEVVARKMMGVAMRLQSTLSDDDKFSKEAEDLL